MLKSLMGKLRFWEPRTQGGRLRTERMCWPPPRLGRDELTSVVRTLRGEGAPLLSAPVAWAPRDSLWLLCQVPRQPQSPAGLRWGQLRQVEEAAVSRAGN